MDTVEIELALIDHLRRLTNTLPVISRESARSVSNRRLQTQMNFTRQKQEPSISFSHKRFRELIKMLLEKNKLFVCKNIHPDPENFRPILYSGYLVTKDADRAAKKMAIIRPGRQKTKSISAS